MATDDITRSAFYRAKRYAGVHMQQGRVLTDDDFNADVDVDLGDDRLTRLGIVGPYGSADRGFAVSNPTSAGGQIDFDIGAGTLYLGGLRLERLSAETFRQQSDWLNNPGATAPGGAGDRFDLVYVIAWLQPVSAVEDSELLEAALGGPDTTTRLRPMARLAVLADVGVDSCEEAWAVLQEHFAGQGFGTVDGEMRLVPDTEFTISFAPGSGGDDLCAPEVVGGYLGAENQAIRITLLGGGRFIWGFDDGAPLYRVQLEDAGQTVRFLTEPKDVAHWPAQGQTVEIIPWSALLNNGEKLAEELVPSHFALVDGPYNPDSGTLTLTAATAVPAAFGTQWQTNFNPADILQTRFGLEAPQQPYYFLRVWNRGAEVTAEPTLPLAPAPAQLGTTGLRLTVSGADAVPGDHCIIAARPQTPDRVVPWELLVGRAPHGIERFVGPVALLRWQGGAGEVVHDCRPPFRPLTRIRNCCTYAVGDGERSHGDFDSIQAAVDALPLAGGEICVLPGIHLGPVLLDGLSHVKISGCGRRSLVMVPEPAVEPVITVNGGNDIRLVGLGISATLGPGIVATGLVQDGVAVPLSGLVMERLEVVVRDASAIDARIVERLELKDSHIAALALASDLGAGSSAGRAPAVFLEGDDMLVAGNRIEAFGTSALRRALGGLQIGGGSEGVVVRDNVIRGGNGNGITLGHFYLADQATAALFANDYAAGVAGAQRYFAGFSISIDENGCIVITPPGSTGDPDDPEPPQVPVSGGDLKDIEIRDNIIVAMALSGIATPLGFRRFRPVIVAIVGLKIDGNIIKGCASLEVPVLPLFLRLYVAFGGISLAAVEIGALTGNHIEANGRSHLDPIVGIQLLQAETVVISDNQIIDNGPRSDTDQTPKPGQRGGIIVLAAAPHPTVHATSREIARIREIGAGFAAARAVGLPALLVHDNVVQQPLGKALVVLGYGHMSISANHLASQGTTTRSFLEPLFEILQQSETLNGIQLLYLLIDRLLGSAVTVLNLGFSSELADAILIFSVLQNAYSQKGTVGRLGGSDFSSNFAMKEAPQLSRGTSVGAKGWGGSARLLRNGEVLFNDNAVVQCFLDGERSFTLSAAFLLTFDDLSVADNSFSSQVDFIGDFSVTNLLAMAWSLRCTSNRCEETILHSLFSAMTIGLYNTTAHNQGTHCFSVDGISALTVDGPNRSLVQLFNPLACGGCLQPPFDGLAKTARDETGKTVPPEPRSIGGYSGLWFSDSLDIDLGAEVDSVTLGFAGGTNNVGIQAFGAIGDSGKVDLTDGREAEITLTGSRIHRLLISNAKAEAVLTRFCIARPQALPGGDLNSANVMTIGR